MARMIFKPALGVIGLLLPSIGIGQQLLETREGDPLYIPAMTTRGLSQRNAAVVKANAAEQSFGAEYFQAFPSKPATPNTYSFMSIGVKAKPTEGYAAVFKNNQFSPGTTISASLNQFKLLDRDATKTNNNFTDWGGIYVGFNFNKYQLYRSDTIFSKQLYSTNFKGFEIGLNYNALIKSQYLFSIKGGYARKSNFSDLDEIEVKDIRTQFDTITQTTRTTTVTKAARQGKTYSEYDQGILKISFTSLTDDSSSQPIQFGWSLYADIKSNSIAVPTTNVGVMLFLAQIKNTISTPILAFDFQFADVGDNKKAKNGMLKRFSLGLTSVIALR